MSATLLYEPTDRRQVVIHASAPSSLIDTLGLPRTLTIDDTPAIGAITGQPEAVRQILDAIRKHGSIDVLVEW